MAINYGMDFQFEENGASVPSDFPVVLIYDGAVARERVLSLTEFLRQRCCPEKTMDSVYCRFDQLEDDRFASEAAEVASAAQMVILATTDGEHLPSAVKSWMDRWLARPTREDAALVATVQGSGSPDQTTRVHCYLHRAALKAQIKFFAAVF